MKKGKSESNELRSEYKRSDFDKMERGKYYERVRANSNVVVLDDDVAEVFPNSEAVNKALHALVDVARGFSERPRGKSGREKARSGSKKTS